MRPAPHVETPSHDVPRHDSTAVTEQSRDAAFHPIPPRLGAPWGLHGGGLVVIGALLASMRGLPDLVVAGTLALVALPVLAATLPLIFTAVRSIRSTQARAELPARTGEFRDVIQTLRGRDS
jgi:hypothetical protein